MIRLAVFGFAVIILMWLSALWWAGVIRAADPPPIAATQPNPDQFMYNGISLAQYSDFSRAVRETGVMRWRFLAMPGCPSESIRPQVTAAINQMHTRWSIDVIEAPASDTTALAVRANCGASFAAVCGGPPVIGCLGRGFPYVNDVDLSTDMAAFYDVSQRSITLHEVAGHASAVWSEQYVMGTFASSSDESVMNTGPLSRHDLGPAEDARWWRTQGSPELKVFGSGYNGAGFYSFACQFDSHATRVSVLYQDYGGAVYWSGLLLPIHPDGNGCQGIGELEGVKPQPGRCIYWKQEAPGSWRVSLNEVRIVCL